MIKNIISDFDGVVTNWYYWYMVKLTKMCKHAERHYGLKDFHTTLLTRFKETSVYYKWIIRDTLARLGYDLSFEPILYKFMVNCHVDDIVEDGFYDYLSEIEQHGINFGIVTNGYEETHKVRIKKLGLSKYQTYYAGGTKHPKPSGYYYDKFNFNPSETLVIGDNIVDILYPYYKGYHVLYYKPNNIDMDIKICYNYDDVMNYIREVNSWETK